MARDDPRLAVGPLTAFATRYLAALGCSGAVSREVAQHLVEADLKGVCSHGTMRLAQYAEWARAGFFDPSGQARLTETERGATVVDGGGGFGIPAMRCAVDEGVARAKQASVAALGVVNVGHTGRLGAFAERAAEANCLAILLGGGSHAEWPQVAPHGGAKGRLPTNPYAFAVPGGENGPVVLDFATSAGAGGKVYAASYAGRQMPEGICIDRDGAPTTDPQAYHDGGALLPMAGPKGYGMALIAELVGGAMLGPARMGLNWICVFVEIGRFQPPGLYHGAAEACLAEIRATPPAAGFERVEVPGERERAIEAEMRRDGVPLPAATIEAIRKQARSMGVDAGELDAAAPG